LIDSFIDHCLDCRHGGIVLSFPTGVAAMTLSAYTWASFVAIAAALFAAAAYPLVAIAAQIVT
jgi:hypothetical protein